ncbi:MAG: hypothetical protein Q8P49_02440 [Candidatus Liptonbacteria bacterium]|nr:hypothetical protein [Candidatus Liptonbacteria bacterium]
MKNQLCHSAPAYELTSLRAYELCAAARRGQAVLSLVLLIGGIVVAVGVTLAFLATSFINSAYGYRAAQRAAAVASSGAYDALQRLSRNSAFSSSGYTLTVGSDSATVTVTQDSPATDQVTITSTATVSLAQKTVRVIVSIDPNTSQTTVVSWTPT